MGYQREMTPGQRRIMDSDLGYDSGERFALLAVSGYEITSRGDDTFGTVFSILDNDTGDEVEVSPVTAVVDVREERVRMLSRVMHLNGKEDAFAA